MIPTIGGHFMKNLFFILLCLFLVSCGASEPRNASISVDYEGSNVFRSHGLYCDEVTLRNAVESYPRPLKVIFSRPACPPCQKVEKFIKDRKLHNDVLIVNAKDKYAQFLMRSMGITGVPIMIILEDGKSERRIAGPMNIAMELL